MDIRRTPKWFRVLKRAALIGAVLAIATPMLGLIIQQRRDARFRATRPAPGTFVDVGGRRIHFRLQGTGEFTFVLEAGLGDYSGNWGEVESALATVGRVFVYDRAGLGWSEAGAKTPTASQIVADLHDALHGARVEAPLILVGHSLGGLTHTLYAMEHPGEVAGLLLLDPSHKDQLSELPAPPALAAFMMKQVSRTAPIGLPQLLMRSPDPVVNQSKHVRAAGAELRAFLRMAADWGNRPIDLGETPIYVLTGADYSRLPGKSDGEKRATWETWKALHAQLVAASSSTIRRHEMIPGASHYFHRSHPERVTSAARELVERIRNQAQ